MNSSEHLNFFQNMLLAPGEARGGSPFISSWLIFNRAFNEEDGMGLLDGLIGGTVGAALITAANEVIEKHGGVEGLVKQFQEKGLAGTIQSWIATGENQPIAPDQVQHALGHDLVKDLAAKAGLSPEDLSKKLAELLPNAIDKLTPGGKLPS
jgi:uncharacterized protein YidB (DUF937 family)